MKNRSLLKAIPRRQSALFLVGLLCAAVMPGAIPGPAQTTQPDAAKPTQSKAPAAPNAPKKISQAGVWHHFGEGDHVSAASQSQPGVWHHFGPDQGTSRVSPDAMAPQPDFGANRMAVLERQMWALVNQDRLDPETFAETGGRAQPLDWNENLAAVARAHSRNMLEQHFFSHVDPDGRTLSKRISEGGISWQAAGENIALYETVKGAEAAFMNEPRFQHNHRGNILNVSYTDVGIGIVQGPDGSLYITQDFVASPPGSGASRSAPSGAKQTSGILRPPIRVADSE